MKMQPAAETKGSGLAQTQQVQVHLCEEVHRQLGFKVTESTVENQAELEP